MTNEVAPSSIVYHAYKLMSKMTEFYGVEAGQEMYDHFTQTMPDAVQVGVFKSMMGGFVLERNSIKLSMQSNISRRNFNKIAIIKAIRTVSVMGLKEAKHAAEDILDNKGYTVIECKPVTDSFTDFEVITKVFNDLGIEAELSS